MDVAADPSKKTIPDQHPAPVPPARRFESRHSGTFNGTAVAYRAIAEETHLTGEDGKPRAALWSVSYLADRGEGADPADRPVTFLFNGGPGSASLWLHMGTLGPRRVAVPGDGTSAGAPPYPVVDNTACPLDVTDLVFIDPVGTGYSRALGETKEEEFWGCDSDAASIAQFIQTWLTRHRRWASPRYVGGESYGTTRAVLVADKLMGGFGGCALNGLILISAVLDFHTARFNRGNLLPEVAYLPTYTAAALYHGKIRPAPRDEARFLDQARDFALEELSVALLKGPRLAPAKRRAVAKRLARFTGLTEGYLDRVRLRLDPSRFRKELLRDDGLTIGRFDARYTGRDLDDAGDVPDNDASAYGIDGAYVAAINDHLGRVLGVEMDRPYRILHRPILEKWDWLGTRPEPNPKAGWPTAVNVAPALSRLLREQPLMRVLIANGLYDLATPFFAVENTLAANDIAAERVEMTYYAAGHMMYVHEPSLDAFNADIRRFISPAG